MIWWMLLLYAGGMVLILAEFILPGAIAGIGGGIFLVICTTLAFAYYPEHAMFIVIAEVCGAALSILLGLYIMAKTDLGKSLRLDKSQNANEGFVSTVSDLSLLGKTGRVMTALRPSGTILLDGERIDAVSTGDFIDADVVVRVTEVHGNRIIVEKAS